MNFVVLQHGDFVELYSLFIIEAIERSKTTRSEATYFVKIHAIRRHRNSVLFISAINNKNIDTRVAEAAEKLKP